MRLEYHSEGDHAGVQWYPVLHRPWALVQWLRHAAKLPEDYVLMAEPDHIFRHIPPLWCAPVLDTVGVLSPRNKPSLSVAPMGSQNHNTLHRSSRPLCSCCDADSPCALALSQMIAALAV